MAEIYDLETGNEISAGLQGSDVCDEAIRAAKGIAADRNEPVQLVDDGEVWDVYPDGTIKEGEAGDSPTDDARMTSEQAKAKAESVCLEQRESLQQSVKAEESKRAKMTKTEIEAEWVEAEAARLAGDMEEAKRIDTVRKEFQRKEAQKRHTGFYGPWNHWPTFRRSAPRWGRANCS